MAEDKSHRLSHQPAEDGDPLHALGSLGMIPPDVYEHPDWYAWGDVDTTHRIILDVRDNPDAEIAIYRAVPPGVTQICHGDWVAITEAYAREHAINNDDPADDWPVISARVPVHTVRSGRGDIVEWGYWGPDISATVVT